MLFDNYGCADYSLEQRWLFPAPRHSQLFLAQKSSQLLLDIKSHSNTLENYNIPFTDYEQIEHLGIDGNYYAYKRGYQNCAKPPTKFLSLVTKALEDILMSDFLTT